MQAIGRVDDPQYVITRIDPGDIVRITTKDGAKTQLTVRSINQEKIVGEEGEVVFADISRIETEQIDPGKTVGAGLGATATVVAVLALAAGLILIDAVITNAIFF
jgi:hypothetical protein